MLKPKTLLHGTRPLTEKGLPAGAQSLISWGNLENLLRTAGTVRPSEHATHFVVSEEGIYVVIESNP